MERTPFMQQLMNITYPEVAIEAIKGGFSGSWERCIARHLKLIYRHHSEAAEIVDYCEGDYMKAAHLITSSQIPVNTTL
jgi:hypothetical protein